LSIVTVALGSATLALRVVSHQVSSSKTTFSSWSTIWKKNSETSQPCQSVSSIIWVSSKKISTAAEWLPSLKIIIKRDKKEESDAFRQESSPDGIEHLKWSWPRKTMNQRSIFGAWAVFWRRLCRARSCKWMLTWNFKAYKTTRLRDNNSSPKVSKNASSSRETHATRSRQSKASRQRKPT